MDNMELLLKRLRRALGTRYGISVSGRYSRFHGGYRLGISTYANHIHATSIEYIDPPKVNRLNDDYVMARVVKACIAITEQTNGNGSGNGNKRDREAGEDENNRYLSTRSGLYASGVLDGEEPIPLLPDSGDNTTADSDDG